jgi:hypothetical protein
MTAYATKLAETKKKVNALVAELLVTHRRHGQQQKT